MTHITQTQQKSEDYECDYCGKTFDTPLKAAVHEEDNCSESPSNGDSL